MSAPGARRAAFPLEIESLAYGGAGVGRRDGRAVFVEGAAPGDLAEVALDGSGKVLRGHLRSLLRPGPGRVQPVCPHFGDCGGCQWQHVASDVQLSAKRRALADALARIGRLPAGTIPEIVAVPAPAAWRYRRRARLALAEGGRLGFMARRSRRVVPIAGCALLAPDLEALVLALLEALARRPVPGLAHVEVCASEGRGAAALELSAGAKLDRARPVAEKLREEVPALAGIVLSAGGQRFVLGDPVLRDGSLFLRPDLFAQASRDGSRRLVEIVLGALRPRPGDRAIELFSGSGNFTFALAERVASVRAVEEEAAAQDLARRALPEALAGRVGLVKATVQEALRAASAAGERFDVALLDPPRAGAREAVELLGRLIERSIAYVSCDPATLARDVGILSRGGWRPVYAAALDLFPQTYHLESLVILERS